MITDQHHLSVLVVDDSPETADSTAELLTLHGHAVRVAYSGEDALSVAVAESPDVVLLDIRMPGLSGWEVARRVRGRLVGKPPVLVAVTAAGTEADRLRSA